MAESSPNVMDARTRKLLPRDERDLTRYTVFALWIATTSVIQAASLIPGLAPESSVVFWRVSLGIPALLVAFSAFFLAPRLGEKAFYRWVVVTVLLGFGVNALLLQITPATLAILTNMLVTVMFTGYFVRRRELGWLMVLGTVIALEPLFTELPTDTPHMASWLAVYVPVMWTIAIALHLQRTSIDRALARAREKALTDPLTGLPNLRAINQRAEQVFDSGSKQSARVHGVLLVDIDNFKSANTLHGHHGGDCALRRVAEQLRAATPGDGMVARVGGDEFAVLAAADDPSEFDELAERLRTAVLLANELIALAGVDIDASIGTAVHPRDGGSFDELLTVADRAMYEEKVRHSEARAHVRMRESDTSDHVLTEVTDAHSDAESGEVTSSVFGRLSVHAKFAALGWLFGCLVLAVGLAMPDADHSHLSLAVALLAVGVVLSFVILFTLPRPHGVAHFVYEAITLTGIALMAALTGGDDSPALALVYVLIVFQAWFWEYRQIVWRAIGPALVVLSPLIYTPLLDAPNREVIGATLYAGVSISLILCFSMYFNQIQLHRIRLQAHHMASTDPLTGVPNRRAFDAFVEQHLASSTTDEPRRELAIVMIDLDNFKEVNTQHGHRGGDILLCEVAEALQMAARADDCVARVGGDEFAAALPDTGREGAAALAERFVQAVAECTSKHDVGAYRAVTASAGFALSPEHGSTLDELMRRADTALMQVKTQGKGSARMSGLLQVI